MCVGAFLCVREQNPAKQQKLMQLGACCSGGIVLFAILSLSNLV